MSAPVLSSCRYWVSRAAVLGEPCGQWAQSALEARGPESLRSIMALCGLIKIRRRLECSVYQGTPQRYPPD